MGDWILSLKPITKGQEHKAGIEPDPTVAGWFAHEDMTTLILLLPYVVIWFLQNKKWIDKPSDIHTLYPSKESLGIECISSLKNIK